MLITHLLGERARQRGDHPFILHEGRRVTYGEFDRLSNRAAHALRTLGVERGDRVTLALGNSVDYLAAAFGVLKAGAILHPVNPALGEHELHYILAHAEPRVIVADAASVERMSAPGLAPPGATLAAFGASGTLALDDLIARSSDSAPDAAVGPADGSTLLYTSGTTGQPKGVLFRHHSTGAAAHHFIELLGIGANDTTANPRSAMASSHPSSHTSCHAERKFSRSRRMASRV